MRFPTKVMVAIVVVSPVLQTSASALPYDPDAWCAQ